MTRATMFAASLLALATAGCTTMDGSGETTATASTSASTSAATSTASVDVMTSTVGGAAMFSNKTIVENAVNSPIHTTLVGAVTAAGLVDTLNSPGPFTVFAPTNEAFAAVPAATLDFLMTPANQAALTKVLTYHVVPGRITAKDLFAQIKAGGGRAMITTVAGEQLTFTESGGNIKVEGTQGSSGFVTQADVMQSNGVIHVVNGVLVPTL